MRLTAEQKQLIIQTFNAFVMSGVTLYLFGSRVHDHLKGGDIDLLLIGATPEIESKINNKKHVILSELKKAIGDQKIDLKISSTTNIVQDAFLSHIFSSAVILKKWT